MDHGGLFAELNAAGVRYLVAGRVAMVLHGVPRMTYDIDLSPDLEEGNLLGLIGLLGRLGYTVRDRREPQEAARPAGRERMAGEGIRVLRFAHKGHTAGEVDVALDLPGPWEMLRDRALEVRAAGAVIPVMASADLAAVKRRMGRPGDNEDLESLAILDRIAAGEAAALASPEPKFDQIRKFRHWEVEKRIEWLVAGAQLRRGPGGGGEPRGPARGRAALGRGRIRGIDHYQDLS